MLRRTLYLVLVALSLYVALPARGGEAPPAALFDYVAKQDDSFAWKRMGTAEFEGVKVHELRLHSQTWKAGVWRHRVYLARPETITAPGHALLIIGGGSWKDDFDHEQPGQKIEVPGEIKILKRFINEMGMPVVYLSHVPFQPLYDGKREDALIAYTFKQFFETGDPEWPLLLPMVKSAVRCMDAVQAFAREEWKEELGAFLVGGGSKRGWTTWLTGATDPRVKGIAPMVIDVLNMAKQMEHQKATWGDFSHKIHDYTELGLQKLMATDKGRELTRIVDPWSYRERLTMPKLIVLGTNDAYWPLDALNNYWDDLSGRKYVLYVPNKGHGIDDYLRVGYACVALARMVAGQQDFPELSWKLNEAADGLELEVCCADPAVERVRAWSASVKGRDFREATWSEQELKGEDGVWRYHLPRPEVGSAAAFAEVCFKLGERPFYLSTQLRIVRGAEAVPAPAEGTAGEGTPAEGAAGKRVTPFYRLGAK